MVQRRGTNDLQRLSAYTEVSAAVHEQPSEDVDDQVPPLQAYIDQTSTVVPQILIVHSVFF